MNPFPSVGTSVLIVDDQEVILKTFSAMLQSQGITNVTTEKDSTFVLDRIERERPDLVLLDLAMPVLPGQDLLRLIHEQHPHLPVVVITGSAELDTVVACMKAGAVDYLVKPVDLQKLITMVHTYGSLRELRQENASLARHLFTRTLEHPELFNDIITRDPRMLALFQYVEAVAFSSHPFLLTGETGTGKELFAAAVHRASGRVGEMVTINAAGLDDAMFSDALFGHRKGAFTGADQPLRGLVDRAGAGTLFLDEIGDLSPASQVKLLRLAETGEYYALGTDVVRRCTARLVVATNKKLEAAVASGAFRSDLYYRLFTHCISIPPLRSRAMDLPLLVEKFVQTAAKELGKAPPAVSRELLARLRTYEFPGNVRELKSMIIDAVGRHREGALTVEMPGGARQAKLRDEETRAVIGFGENLPTIQQTVRMLVREALGRSGGNQTAAARLLGISQQALSKRLKGNSKSQESLDDF
ncbi:MAG: sigma-54 dependent transcriptional regulator [Rectinemataceae bacterium]|jgi:DNA-binding NtrC family response regulator